jgi:glycosyltransferase involved in cell wall biosynthesis
MQRAAGKYAEHFTLLPPVDDAPLYLRASDLFVNSAAKSSYSRGVQEAFALDVPVVTAPYCGFGSFLLNGVNALRWEPEKPAELAKAIRRGLEDDALRQRLRDQGRRTLDALPTFAETVSEYRKLLFEAAICEVAK